MSSPSFAWIAPEYEFRPKEASWFWMSVIAAVLLVAFATWQKNYLFGLFVVIAEVLIIVWGAREPRLVNFHLSEKKLTIDGRKAYALTEITHWSLEEPAHSEWANAFLHFRRPYHWGIRIHIPKAHLGEVRGILGRGAPEVEREENIIEVIEEYLGF
jgi:hypothetical protein